LLLVSLLLRDKLLPDDVVLCDKLLLHELPSEALLLVGVLRADELLRGSDLLRAGRC
jgi:hypothetical protein